jgi:hypothetical protein
MSNFVHNERVKMAANLFNNLAVVSMATGFVVPLISVFLLPRSAAPVVTELPINVGAIAFCLSCFAVFVTAAQVILTDLKE